MTSFKPLVAGDRDGECVITLLFDDKPTGMGVIVAVTGCDLSGLYDHLGDHLAG